VVAKSPPYSIDEDYVNISQSVESFQSTRSVVPIQCRLFAVFGIFVELTLEFLQGTLKLSRYEPGVRLSSRSGSVLRLTLRAFVTSLGRD
jgi:hypothetical protein